MLHGTKTRRRVLELAGSLAAFGLSGTAAGRTGGHGGESDESVTFGEPVRLNPPGNYGYEPSVNVDEFGTVYATAHKASITNEGDQLSSWLWYSADGGETWNEMPSPATVHEKQFAFEGHIAVDDAGSVYYVDTYLADNTLSRWSTEPSGPVWDLSRPAQGTSGIDDRPWLRAHGDGVVYYIGNNGLNPPAPENPGDGGARYWFYRSEDGGQTWTAGRGFPGSGWASLAASDADDRTVYVAFGASEGDSGFPQETLDVATSTDRGETWQRESVGTFDAQAATPFPVWSDTDRAGNPYHAWIDDDPSDEEPGVVNVTRGEPGNWETLDVTPFEGAFQKPWIAGGREGLVAVTFYATEPGVVGVDDETNWYVYALVTADALADDPEWTLVLLDQYPVATDGSEPEDFFECAIGPEDRIHVTYAREIDTGTLSNPTRTYSNNLFYVQGRLERPDDDHPGRGRSDPGDRGPP